MLSPSGRVAVVAPRGEVDVATVGRLRRELQLARLSTAPLVVLDLAAVTFCDSTGIAAVVAAHRQLAPSVRRLLVVNTPPVLEKALDALGLLRLLDVWGGSPPLADVVRDARSRRATGADRG